MITRIRAHISKELLLLFRDRAGLALLFAMPACLVVIMALVQDAPFRDFSDRQLQVVYKDLDRGDVGRQLREGLERSGSFTITDGTDMTPGMFLDAIRKGQYQVGIMVPEGASKVLEARASSTISSVFGPLTGTGTGPGAELDSATVRVIMDPEVKHAFRQLVHASVRGILSGLSSDRLLDGMRAELEQVTGDSLVMPVVTEPFVDLHEEMAGGELMGERVAHDSTQHNVPAWTVFAMFFTVVLLGGNMVKERESGRMLRLLTMPGGTGERILGRMTAYLMVCVAQGILLVLIGMWFLPLIGLPQLRVAGPSMIVLLFIAAVTTALAATSLGVLVGSMSRSQQQSAVLGSTFVVIMSAIGGIWVPLYIMPPAMRALGQLSPLHWGLEAFNVPLLREGDLWELLPSVAPLLLFSVVCIIAAIVAERRATYR
jgi:ABC-2 type transport system permease protein